MLASGHDLPSSQIGGMSALPPIASIGAVIRPVVTCHKQDSPGSKPRLSSRIGHQLELANEKFGNRVKCAILKRHDGVRSRLRMQIDWQCLEAPLLGIITQDGASNDCEKTAGRQKVIPYMHRIGRNVCVFRRSRPGIPSEGSRPFRLKPAGDSDDSGHLLVGVLVSASLSVQLAGSASSL